MATTQALLIENTIKDLKKAMSRNDDASDSDSSITRHTNRGNKLKRKAKYVREGHLAQADGPQVYKRRIMYNGFERSIISRNPPRIDPDGDVVDSDEHSAGESTDAEDDPYRDVRLENILMPLTSAADLDKHPALSVPYTDQVLEQMVHKVQELVHREQSALWRLKTLVTQFCGDEQFATVGAFQGAENMEDFESRQEVASVVGSVDNDPERVLQQPAADWDTMANVRLVAGHESAADSGQPSKTKKNSESEPQTGANLQHTHEDEPTTSGGAINGHLRAIGDNDQRMNTDQPAPEPPADPTSGQNGNTDQPSSQQADQDDAAGHDQPHSGQDKQGQEEKDTQEADQQHPTSHGDQDTEPAQHDQQPNGDSHHPNEPTTNGDNISAQDHAMSDAPADAAFTTSAEPRRMTTRAHTRAKAPDTNGQPTPPLSATDPVASPHLSTAQTASSAPLIHPFFIPPPQSLPTANSSVRHPGIADEIRKQLIPYVQKQQEVVRQSNEMLSGLRKALRLKNMVWDWCRSEGHVGEMSDGEDWIDAEKWDVPEGGLRKGEEVEDEDTAGMVVKTTRNRRRAQ